jgi:hypothetical protein
MHYKTTRYHFFEKKKARGKEIKSSVCGVLFGGQLIAVRTRNLTHCSQQVTIFFLGKLTIFTPSVIIEEKNCVTNTTVCQGEMDIPRAIWNSGST